MTSKSDEPDPFVYFVTGMHSHALKINNFFVRRYGLLPVSKAETTGIVVRITNFGRAGGIPPNNFKLISHR